MLRLWLPIHGTAKMEVRRNEMLRRRPTSTLLAWGAEKQVKDTIADGERGDVSRAAVVK